MNESLAIEVKIHMPRIKIMNDAKQFNLFICSFYRLPIIDLQ